MEVLLITEADLPPSKELSIPNLSNWPGQSLPLVRDIEVLRKTSSGAAPILWRATSSPRAQCTACGWAGGPDRGGHLGRWSPEVFLAAPLRNGHISTLLRPQALLTLAFPLLPAAIKSSGQSFCKSVAKGQAASMPRNNHRLTGKCPEREHQVCFPSSSESVD